MVEITDEFLAAITDRLVAALQPRRIYLFGSCAYGRHGPDSDLDLLIVVGAGRSGASAVGTEARRAIGDVGCGVDVIIRTHEEFERRAAWPTNLEATVKSKGRLLYG